VLCHHPLLFVSDDDDEDDDSSKAGNDTEVKPEPGHEVAKKGKNREGTPSYELHIYTVEELQRFKQRDMVADTELLDGETTCFHLHVYWLSFRSHRKTKECQAESECLERIPET
jgi:hypothetical protein